MDDRCYVPGCKAHNHNTYYGRDGSTQKKGLYLHMLDEHIKSLIAKNEKIFKQNILDIKNELKESYKEEFSGVRSELKTLRKKLEAIQYKLKKDKEEKKTQAKLKKLG
jgi:regulator of PEP synthase PpsR (kinase-PPPase family)